MRYNALRSYVVATGRPVTLSSAVSLAGFAARTSTDTDHRYLSALTGIDIAALAADPLTDRAFWCGEIRNAL